MKATASIIQKIKSWQEVMKACLEKMEANPKEMKFIVGNQDVPKVETAVKSIRALKKQYGNRNLAVGHC
jgi:hypothetical protein